MKKISQKIAIWFIILAYCLSMFAFAAPDGSVNVKILVSYADSMLIPLEEINVTNFDITGYGFSQPSTPTVFQALAKAVELAGHNPADPAFLNVSSYGYLNSVYGHGPADWSDPVCWMYTVNGAFSNNSLPTQTISEGDEIIIFAADWMSANYASFDQKEVLTYPGGAFDLTLSGYSINDSMSGKVVSNAPIEGATILSDGGVSGNPPSATVFTTDAAGKAALGFSSPGTYLLSAIKKSGSTVLMNMPYCKVTVADISEAEIQSSLDIINPDKDALTLPVLAESDLTLPLIGQSTQTTIRWSSDRPYVLSSTGAVMKQSADTTVNLTATISLGAVSVSKTFAVTVPAYTSADPEYKLALAKSAILGEGAVNLAQAADSNVVPKVQAIVDRAVSGVTVSLLSSAAHWGMDASGNAFYGSNTISANVSFTLSCESKTDSVAVLVNVLKSGTMDNETAVSILLNSMAAHYKNTADSWQIMDMCRFGKANDVDRDRYLSDLKVLLNANGSHPATDYEKAVLTLTALGINPVSFDTGSATVDLIDKIVNYPSLESQTIYSRAFALLALDSGSYAVPAGAANTRETIKAQLLGEQNAVDHSWSDVDTTSIVISALAPYYRAGESPVVAAVDQAVAFLSSAQQPNGGFLGGNELNSNSSAMVIAALTSIGKDADQDPAFIKNGLSAVDALLSFKTSQNLFSYTGGDTFNEMSTEQAFRALIPYQKFCYYGTAASPYVFDASSAPNVSFQLLSDKITEAQGKSSSNYTTDSFARLTAQIENAVAVRDNASATAANRADAYFALVSALSSLAANTPPVTPNTQITVTVSVTGDAAHGTILAGTPVTVNSGSTVWTAVSTALQNAGIPYVSRGGYLSTVNGLSEFDNGPLSGWIYSINGIWATVGMDLYPLSGGESISVVFTEDASRQDGLTWGPQPIVPQQTAAKKLAAVPVRPAVSRSVGDFSDAPTLSPWALPAVDEALRLGLIQGDPQRRLNPQSSLTYAELFTMLFNLSGTDPALEKNYAPGNILQSAWYYSSVNKAFELGLASHIASFNPDANVPREDMAYIISLLFELPESEDAASSLRLDDVSGWAADAVRLISRNGIMVGNGVSFDPQGTVTREMAVTVMVRLYHMLCASQA